MANKEHIEIFNRGVKGWNEWRKRNPETRPDLSFTEFGEVNLDGYNLRNCDLSDTTWDYAKIRNTDFSYADLGNSDFIFSKLHAIDFSFAILNKAILKYSTIVDSNFTEANLTEADISGADLSKANFTKAILQKAQLTQARIHFGTLDQANLSNADLTQVLFDGTSLNKTDFSNAKCGFNIFAKVNLSTAENLETISHGGSSTIGINTLLNSKGKIPDSFLKECGVPKNFIDSLPLLLDGKTLKTAEEDSASKSTVNVPSPTVENNKTPLSTVRNQVFISYSHRDKKWLEKLTNILHPSVRQDTIKIWDDTQIAPGAKWKEEIQSALALTKVAIFLVSPSFLRSDFIANEELPPLLKAAEEEGVTILWIPVSHSMYKTTVFSQYQAAIDPKRPLDTYRTESSQNETLVKIGDTILEAMGH